MLEFMDSVAVNAVEDKLRMGLDRGAAALVIAGSDERGQSAGEDAEVIATVFAENDATEVFSTDDPDEGEAFVAARRYAIPAVEAKGRCCWKTSVCRCPGWVNSSPESRASPPTTT